MIDSPQAWPALPYADLRPTLETLHLWTQIAGKVRLARTPWINHGWQVTLLPSVRGLRTGLIPHDRVAFDLEFDVLAGALWVRVTDGGERRIELTGGRVADFRSGLLEALAALGVPVSINDLPNEVPDPVPFSQDFAERAYDPQAARVYWQALLQVDRVFTRFRSRFIGKCSPTHLFWGSFDLAVTRFSGRPAPLHPGGVPHLPDRVTREAYSHEVSSAGFWPGSPGAEEAAFYSYAYPTPAGFAEAEVEPSAAYFDPKLGEFLLPYDAVRRAPDPDAALLGFLQSTYDAAADLAGWDRAALDIAEGLPGHPRDIPPRG
ncbi:hypothetical protein F0L46_19630 [Salinarimonas soli]|uniref:Ava_C0101 and related proteins n=2 Tax=Salinarimonas soli TaxID=1638099 RepID=A0A5B2V8Z5_9HYPH|nr:hypothetical protein F0L46_19630 [Salinarimonas soli]